MINNAIIRGYIVSDLEKADNEVHFIVSVKKNYRSKKNGFYGYNFIHCMAYSGYANAILKNFATGSMVLLAGSLETFTEDGQTYFVVNNIDFISTMEEKEENFKEVQIALKQYLEWKEYLEKRETENE